MGSGDREEEIMVNLLQVQQPHHQGEDDHIISITSNNNYDLLTNFLNFPSNNSLLTSTSTSFHHLISSLHTSSSSSFNYPWDVGEEGNFVREKNRDDNDNDDGKLQLRVSSSRATTTKKMKRIKAGGRKKVREPRFSFKTMSEVDVLDDGYKWRKYGQKLVKLNTLHPRSYYRCTQDNCKVKKRVERLAEDPRMVITTYEGRHAHSPSPDSLEGTMDQMSSGHLNNFF